LVNCQPQDGFRGVLRAGLPEVIQLECLGRKSSVLEVSTHSINGHIVIEKGSIIHAAAGDLKGEAAFNALLGLDGGEFNLRPFVAPAERTVEGQWESLLMEAARLRDEIAEQNNAADAEPKFAPGERPASDSAQSPIAQGQFGPAPATVAARDAAPGLRNVEEFVVCSSQGDVLYEWQCVGIEMRIKLFDLIARRAAEFGQRFSLGNFDRLEIAGPQCRVVTQIHSDRRLLLRTAPLSDG
jgi:hypothetical protein